NNMNLWDNTLNFTSNDNMKEYDKSVESNNNPTNNNMLLDKPKQPINPTYPVCLIEENKKPSENLKIRKILQENKQYLKEILKNYQDLFVKELYKLRKTTVVLPYVKAEHKFIGQKIQRIEEEQIELVLKALHEDPVSEHLNENIVLEKKTYKKKALYTIKLYNDYNIFQAKNQ
ncbi:12222_t:CDS:2, partial [Cetraspora pellucida]